MSGGPESQFLRNITDHMAEGVFVLNRSGEVKFMNPEAERLLGWSLEELQGKSMHQSIHHHTAEGEELHPGECLIMRSINDCAVYRTDNDAYVRKDGSMFAVSYVAAPMLENGEVTGAVVVFSDVSERKKSEAQQKALTQMLHEAQVQLLQSEKMASIGQLAAGVAHEINNPVGYVSSNLTTLQKYVEDLFSLLDAYARLEQEVAPENAIRQEIDSLKQRLDLDFLREDLSDLMSESQEGISRVRQIVQDLKDFSHVDEAEWQWADLHKSLDSTLNIVHNELKYKAEVIKEYDPDIPHVECIASQLNQVFMNLLVNAAHAIENRGTITVRTLLRSPEWVAVEITDTGTGIPQDKLGRIFDPFYTTKPVGKGTGLGLSLAYGIVQKHDGEIEVESEVGKGTTFRVSLPVQQAEPKADIQD